MFHDVAVVMTTLVRPTLERAVRSVYTQNFSGRIQIVLCLDGDRPDLQSLARLRDACPSHCTLTIIALGYSTSVKGGGFYSYMGGALRAIGTFAALARHVAYLDDDDWYSPDHLRSMLGAIAQKDWAFSLSWYVNPVNNEPMCVDLLESVGPDRGAYREMFGGFVRPSCLMIDKLACANVLHHWCEARFATGKGSDRNVFSALCQTHPFWGQTGQASVYYTIQDGDINHAVRTAYVASMGYDISRLASGNNASSSASPS